MITSEPTTAMHTKFRLSSKRLNASTTSKNCTNQIQFVCTLTFPSNWMYNFSQHTQFKMLILMMRNLDSNAAHLRFCVIHAGKQKCFGEQPKGVFVFEDGRGVYSWRHTRINPISKDNSRKTCSQVSKKILEPVVRPSAPPHQHTFKSVTKRACSAIFSRTSTRKPFNLKYKYN